MNTSKFKIAAFCFALLFVLKFWLSKIRVPSEGLKSDGLTGLYTYCRKTNVRLAWTMPMQLKPNDIWLPVKPTGKTHIRKHLSFTIRVKIVSQAIKISNSVNLLKSFINAQLNYGAFLKSCPHVPQSNVAFCHTHFARRAEKYI